MRCNGYRVSGYWKGKPCGAEAKHKSSDGRWWCKNHLPVEQEITLTSLQAAAAKLREHAVPVRVVESQTEAEAMTYWDASGREWVVGDTYYLIHLAPCGHKNTQSVSEPDGTLFRCLDCGAGRK